MRKFLQYPLIRLVLTLIAIGFLVAVSPAENALGSHVRIVYLHGAWVWAALAAFVTAAFLGLVGLFTRQGRYLAWSAAFGWTGLLFWITYLPLSLWAMDANWNGLFLAEPRWRLALAYAAGGLVLQIGLALVRKPTWVAVGNLFFSLMLVLSVTGVDNVMHPASPIFSSDAQLIQLFFAGLFMLTLLAAFWVASFLKDLA